MSDQSAKVLFQQAVAAARQRDTEAARKLIQASLRQDPSNPVAWLILASVTPDKREKLVSLKKTLELDPQNAQALKMVRDMGLDPAALLAVGENAPKPMTKPFLEPPPVEASFVPEIPTTAPLRDIFAGYVDPEDDDDDAGGEFGFDAPDVPERSANQPARPAPPIPKVTGVAPRSAEPPLPSPRPLTFEERLAQAAEAAEQTAAGFLKPTLTDPIEWIKKDHNRAGENEIVMVRVAAGTAIGVSGFIGLLLLGILLLQIPFFRNGFNPAPTARYSSLTELTATPTPLTTATPSPGFTATASITPTPSPEGVAFTPSPTRPSNLLPGDPNNPRPTDIFLPGVEAPSARNAIAQIDQGRATEAVATLQTERGGNVIGFDASLFYSEALALARLGQGQAGLDLLEEGEQLRTDREPNDTSAEATIQGGFAQVYLILAQEALANGNPARANQFFDQLERSARRAITLEGDWAEMYAVLIERYKAANNLDAALQVVEQAQARPELALDMRFVVARAQIAYTRGNLNQANYQVDLALYADPRNRDALELRTQIALEGDDPGLAVLYAQAYIFYHEQEVRPWLMLAQARLNEGNPQLALESYSRAIIYSENVQNAPSLEAYLGRADIYLARHQYDLAMADLERAATIATDADVRERVFEMAISAGRYDFAQSVAQTLQIENAISPGEVNFANALVLASGAALEEEDYREIRRLIDGGIVAIPASQQALAQSLRAEAAYALGDYESALNFINTAILAGATAERHELRGRIYIGQRQYLRAIVEFERAFALNGLYPVPPAVLDRIINGQRQAENLLAESIAAATATAQARP